MSAQAWLALVVAGAAAMLGYRVFLERKKQALTAELRDKVMGELDAGRLPEFTNHGLALKPGEHVHFMASAELLEYRAKKGPRMVTYGGLTFSAPIAKGVRIRAGRMAVAVDSVPRVLTAVDSGMAYVTSTRVFFDGREKNISVGHGSLMAISVASGAVQLDRDKGKDVVLKVADSETFAAVLSVAAGT